MLIEESLAAREIDRVIKIGLSVDYAIASSIRVLTDHGFGSDHAYRTSCKIAYLMGLTDE